MNKFCFYCDEFATHKLVNYFTFPVQGGSRDLPICGKHLEKWKTLHPPGTPKAKEIAPIKPFKPKDTK